METEKRKAIALPAFLTQGIEDEPSLYAVLASSSDSDEIWCSQYDSCGKYTYPCSCYNNCDDCSDRPCSDSPVSSTSLSLSGGKGTLTWTISGLSSAFNTTNYKSVGITRDKFTVGGVSSISGVAASKNAPSSGSSTSVSQTIDYPPGTYTFWGFAQTPSGGNPQYWPAGSDTVTVLPKNINFDWDYAGRNPTTGVLLSGTQKQGGLGIYIGANEWNRLVDATNEKMGTGIPYVAKNSEITAAVVNRVASALGVQSVTAGRTEISAAFFNQLRAAVNS